MKTLTSRILVVSLAAAALPLTMLAQAPDVTGVETVQPGC